MMTRAQSFALLLLGTVLPSAIAQELVVVVESPPFMVDTRSSSSGSDTSGLVVTAASPAFTLDTRLSVGAAIGGLVVTAESPAFTLDTRLASGPTPSTLVVTAESPAFTLDTRLSCGNPILAALVVSAESAAFVLDTRLAARLDYLIVEAVSPAFELNTMWVRLRLAARAAGSPVELYWPTNAPGFYPQSAPPPLRPSMPWQNMTNTVGEAGGFYRTLLDPAGAGRYFRLKL